MISRQAAHHALDKILDRRYAADAGQTSRDKVNAIRAVLKQHGISTVGITARTEHDMYANGGMIAMPFDGKSGHLTVHGDGSWIHEKAVSGGGTAKQYGVRLFTAPKVKGSGASDLDRYLGSL